MPDEHPHDPIIDLDHGAAIAVLVGRMLERHDLDVTVADTEVVVHLPATDFTITEQQIGKMADTARALKAVCGMPLGQGFASQVHMLVLLLSEVVAEGGEHLLGGVPR